MNKAFLISFLLIYVVACTPQNIAPATTQLPSSPNSTVALTFTATSTPEIIPTQTPTPELPDQILHSPNGEYIAEFDNAHSHPARRPQVIEILDKSGSLLWEIPYQHETSQVDPHPGLRIYGWSKDSNYLYFYYEFSLDGGDMAFWWDGFDFQRIRVQTGKIEQVIPSERQSFVAFAFSSDEMQLAYTREQDTPSVIFIRNLTTGVEKKVNVILGSKNYERVGDIHWSSSGTEIAFQAQTSDYIAQTIYLDLSTMRQKIIRTYEVDTSYFQGWTDDGSLEFIDFENGVYIVHVNPKNEEMIIIGTPTPQS